MSVSEWYKIKFIPFAFLGYSGLLTQSLFKILNKVVYMF